MASKTTVTNQIVVRCRTKNFVKKMNGFKPDDMTFLADYFSLKSNVVVSKKQYRGMNKIEVSFLGSAKEAAKDAIAIIDRYLEKDTTEEGE